MAISVSLDNSQRVLLTATFSDGSIPADTAFSLSDTSLGTLTSLAKDGSALPANQVAFVTADGATGSVTLTVAGGGATDTATLTVSQVASVLTVTLSASTPEAK